MIAIAISFLGSSVFAQNTGESIINNLLKEVEDTKAVVEIVKKWGANDLNKQARGIWRDASEAYQRIATERLEEERDQKGKLISIKIVNNLDENKKRLLLVALVFAKASLNALDETLKSIK